MATPKVSVLMPIFNTREQSLREAIESILDQTFTDFELLIVNDSPQNTDLEHVVRSFTDPRIRYFCNDENIGLERSTNKLISFALGEYVAPFDHDDISLPQRLQAEVDYLDQNPAVGVVSAQFEVFGVENWTSENPISSDDIRQGLEQVSCISHTTAMFRKSVLTDNHIAYEPEFFPAASYRILTRVALVSDVHNLPEVLLRYRMDGTNTSLQFADERSTARERVRLSYIRHRRDIEQLADLFSFDHVTCLLGRWYDNGYTRHYKATRNGDEFFIKASAESLANEYQMTSELFAVDGTHFVEPVALHEGPVQYLVMRWMDGVNLEDFLSQSQPSVGAPRNDALFQDLKAIADALAQADIVHRDIIPRNLLVCDGQLRLTDLYFAVHFNDYHEYDYVEHDIALIGSLGESFALGVCLWDDAYSLTRVAELIGGKQALKSPDVIHISDRIGERTITVDPKILMNNVRRFRNKSIVCATRAGQLEEQVTEKASTIAALQSEIESIRHSRSYRLGHAIGSPYRALQGLFSGRTPH